MDNLVLTETDNSADQCRERLVNSDRQVGKVRHTFGNGPILSSAHCGWHGFLLECVRLGWPEVDTVRTPLTLVAMPLGAPIRVSFSVNDGTEMEKLFHPDEITVVPAGTRFSIHVTEPTEFMIMSLSDELVSRARKAARAEVMELESRWGYRDNFVRETLQRLRQLIEINRPADTLFAETLAMSLALHLFRNLKNGIRNGRSKGGHGLSQPQLEQTIEFIRTAPYREISLSSMAKAAGLSPFHFSRMFKLSTGLSPHQFVLKRRLEIGAKTLATTTTAISDIAADLGFADQSHFTMHFKRLHGVAPACYRRQHKVKSEMRCRPHAQPSV